MQMENILTGLIFLMVTAISLNSARTNILKPSYLAKVGSTVTLTCHNSNHGIEWEKDEKVVLNNSDTLILNRANFKDSGKYDCFENVMFGDELRFVHHKTAVLIVDHDCHEIDKSQNIKCSMTYEESKDGEDELLTYRLCEPLQQNGIQIDTLKWKDGNKINRVLIIEKDKQHCIFIIGFINSTLRIWPDHHQPIDEACHTPDSLLLDSNEYSKMMLENKFFGTSLLAMFSIIVLCLTIALTCQVRYMNRMLTKLKNYGLEKDSPSPWGSMVTCQRSRGKIIGGKYHPNKQIRF